MTFEFEVKIWDGKQYNVLCEYAKLLSKVYDRKVETSVLQWKHNDNPMGKSIITYCENDKGEIIAARAFWRMYSSGAPLYQPCDTVTHPNFQGRGLFTRLTLASLAELPSDSAIINFPNHNSFPGYLKMGWLLFENNKKILSFNLGVSMRRVNDLSQVLKQKISSDELSYLLWRYNGKSGKNYKFWITNSYLIIDNGEQCGAKVLDGLSPPFMARPGFSQGYVLPSNFSAIKGVARGSMALKCNSRTAYFLKEKGVMATIEKSFNDSQVNLLMDTF